MLIVMSQLLLLLSAGLLFAKLKMEFADDTGQDDLQMRIKGSHNTKICLNAHF